MNRVQDMISWWRTSFGEEEIKRISQAIHHECISQGPVTSEFEARLAEVLDVPYVVATTSGSIALLMACIALGIKEGDEVIVPNRTWIATAHAPKLLGAKIITVDVMPDAPIMDVSKIREKITPRTKAIIPVPLGGRAVNMDEIWEIAKEHGLCVVEDTAQGLFSKYSGSKSEKYMGTESDLGCFSLSVAKLLPTGQGGFVVTKKKQIYERLKRVRMHGVDDVIDCTFHQMGFNFRFTDILAAIGLVQLERIPQRILHLKEIYTQYEEGIQGLSFLKLIPVNSSHGEVPLYVEVLCEGREKLANFLAANGIQTRPLYPCLNSAEHLGISGQFMNSKKFGEQGLLLPCGPEQSFENVDCVIQTLKIYEEDLK